MNTQTEVLKRNIDNMIIQENQGGLNDQEKFIMQKLMREKYQQEHESKQEQREEDKEE
ncbi:hypothetical protein SAMN04488688_104150 [Paenibacillus sp. cl141a]|uniref:hypothetical protein n=1 Tax=Bacillales TaxID=1385 RepID=UPI0001788C44|nr:MULTISPECIES: hypothetical protein [Paenibacillus]MBY0164396.1 hypothetical protein [Cytobacillus firmus]VTR57680.1 Uncharacterised protein [Actinobacillus pleuropneumoniae]ACX62840.1 hypothetical protein GYMC10_0537 [Paenibacillus sp. Y412MC10]EGG36183.1 conserved domain protein [Paenibacillus sp. HGF5]ETT59858.1 hypothetical protein C172_23528 [Paenibacillus sp. FSL H8-457]